MDPEADSEQAVESSPEAEPSPQKSPKHYEIEVFPDWCKACGICAAFCPKECISQDEEGRPVLSAAWKCTGCRWCELHCPDFAICVRECQEKVAREEAD